MLFLFELTATAGRDRFWANERTLLAWLNFSIFLAIAAVQLLTLGDRAPQIAGTVISPLAIMISIYALTRFHLRNVAIFRSDQDQNMQFVIDFWGPWVAVPALCLCLVLLAVFSFLF
jgi:uncharacterized membrane protein YidH (DUF202 family)